MKFSRNDLNIYHLLARGGLNAYIHDYDKSLLLQYNKNGWLPVHLSKNKEIAQILYDETIKQGISHEEIVHKALLNNAQSIQTKYGKDLLEFFKEQQFSLTDCNKAATEPSYLQRIDLSFFWLNHVNFSDVFHSIEDCINIALQYSNSYFFFALHKINHHEIYELIHRSHVTIGEDYYISDRAFQLQELLMQKYNKYLPIAHNTINLKNFQTNDYLKNLEGF